MYLTKNLIQGSTLTTAAAVYYTVPTGVSTQLVQLSFCNTDTVARTVSVYLANDATAPATTDYLVKNKTLQPNETWTPQWALGAVLSAAGTIQAIADANSVVVIKASGLELTA